jgi:DNA-binding MarR family transcriptional regulator
LTTPSSEPLTASRRAEQAANLLGALGLAVRDRITVAVTEAAGGAASDATALSALLHFLVDPRIDQLAQVLGLSSSGTVRLVDRLQGLGLVQRSAGDDARATTVTVTAAGRARAEEVSRARTEALERALAPLSPAERDQFGVLAGENPGRDHVPPGRVRMDVPTVRYGPVRSARGSLPRRPGRYRSWVDRIAPPVNNPSPTNR